MTDKEKQILIADLCARLPYHLKIHTQYNLYEGHGKDEHKIGVKEQIGVLTGFGDINNIIVSFEDYNWESYGIEDVKPYLRPLSSMTDSEKEYYYGLTEMKCTLGYAIDKVRFCLEHHLDMSNLIPKGLALEAPEGVYE